MTTRNQVPRSRSYTPAIVAGLFMVALVALVAPAIAINLRWPSGDAGLIGGFALVALVGQFASSVVVTALQRR